MPQHIAQVLQTRLTPIRIVLIYFLVGSAWIILSALWLLQQNEGAEPVIDKAGYFIEANEATQELTEYSAEELKKIRITNLVISDLEDTKKAFKDLFIDGYASRDRTIRCKNGSEKIIRVDGVRHTENQAITFSRDITDRKQNEYKLLRLNAMLRAIRRVNQAIIWTPEIDELIRKICEILVEDREFKHAWIALLDDDEIH